MWCFVGDSNALRRINEREGSTTRSSQSRGFNSFIKNNHWLDIPIVGRKCTWYKANGTTKSRLDKTLVSYDGFQKWPMCK